MAPNNWHGVECMVPHGLPGGGAKVEENHGGQSHVAGFNNASDRTPRYDDEEFMPLGTAAGAAIVEENKARGIKCSKPDPWRRLRHQDDMGKRMNAGHHGSARQQRMDADKASHPFKPFKSSHTFHHLSFPPPFSWFLGGSS